MKHLRAFGWTTSILISFVLLCGCATQRVDWATRVGNYTFDQAIAEIGPPDKQARLTDGSTVAEWLTRRGYREVYPVGAYHFHGPYHHYYPYRATYVDSYSPDYFLRLTFGPDGRLTAWKKLTR